MLSLAGISWEKYKMNCTQTPYFSFPKKYIIISLSFSGSFFMLGWLSNDPHLSKFLGSQNLMFWPPWETGSSFLYKGGFDAGTKAKAKATPVLSPAVRRVKLVTPLVKLHLWNCAFVEDLIGMIILFTISSNLHFSVGCSGGHTREHDRGRHA